MKEEIFFDIISFKFYPIFIDENSFLQYNVTPIDKPDVILNNTGLIWEDANWGDINCTFHSIDENLECEIKNSQDYYSIFAVQTNNNYNAGILSIVMKVLNPNQNINIIVVDRGENFHNIYSIRATTEYAEYRIPLPSIENYATYKYGLMETSKLDNIYYIKSIVYYPPNIPIPENNKTSTIIEIPSFEENSIKVSLYIFIHYL